MAELLSRAWPVVLLFVPAILVGFSMAIAGGTAGVVVLLRREALVALALPQVVLLGVAFGLRYLGEVKEPPPIVSPAPADASKPAVRDIDAELGLAPVLGATPPPAPHANDHAESATLTWLKIHVGWPTLPGAVLACAVAMGLISLGRSRSGERSGATRASAVVVPAIYVAAGALAILTVANSGQHLVDLKDRYVGVDIAVDDHLAEISVPPLLIVAALIALLWRRWMLIAQVPAAAALARLRPARWDALFLLLLSTILLIATNAIGPVLVTSLLFLPAATVLPWCKRVPTAMWASVVVAVLIYAGGFLISNGLFVANAAGLPLGHSVGGLGGGCFVVSYLASRLRG